MINLLVPVLEFLVHKGLIEEIHSYWYRFGFILLWLVPWCDRLKLPTQLARHLTNEPFVDHLCLVFLKLLRLFIAVLCLSAGKGLTSWLLLVMLSVFCYFPVWYPGSDVVLDCIVS